MFLNPTIILYIYTALVLVVTHLSPDSVFKDVLTTPFFFLLPVGVGKLLLKLVKRVELSRDNIFSFLLGYISITMLFYSVQSFNLYIPYNFEASLLLLALAIFNIKLPGQVNYNKKDFKRATVFTVLFFILFYFNFVHLSNFQIRDLFQNVHFLKGIQEFSRFNFINFETANSYIPTSQVVFGVIAKIFKVNSLNIDYLIAPIMYFLHYQIFNRFIKQQIKNEDKTFLATLIVLISYKSVLAYTNGTLIFAYCVYLLSFLSGNFNTSKDLKKIIPLSLLIFGVKILFFKKYITYPIAIFSSLLLSFFIRSKYSAYILISILISMLHRSFLLFFPIVAISYILIRLINLEDNRKVKVWPSLFALIVFLITIAIWATEYFFKLNILRPLFINIASQILGVTIRTNSLDTGGNIINTIIEWVRNTSPIIHILLSFFIIKNFRNKLIPKRESRFLVISFVIMTITFIPAVYAYRGQFFASLFIMIFIANTNIEINKLVSRVIFLIYSLMLFTIYNPFLSLKLKMLSKPDFYITASYLPIIVSTILLGLNLLKLFKRPLIILLLLIFIDRILIHTRFNKYSFGEPPIETEVISHYTQQDIENLAYFETLPHGSIVLSDPKTLAILKAMTGLNGFFTFANISAIDPITKQNLMEYFNLINQSSSTQQISKFIKDKIHNNVINVSEMNFLSSKLTKNTKLSTYDLFKNHIYIVYSKQTSYWKDCLKKEYDQYNKCYNYFPKERDIDPIYINKVREHYEEISNNNDYFIGKLKATQ